MRLTEIRDPKETCFFFNEHLTFSSMGDLDH